MNVPKGGKERESSGIQGGKKGRQGAWSSGRVEWKKEEIRKRKKGSDEALPELQERTDTNHSCRGGGRMALRLSEGKKRKIKRRTKIMKLRSGRSLNHPGAKKRSSQIAYKSRRHH